MTTKLSPNAFRVWDNQERRYFDQHEDCFVLTAAGVLCRLELTPIKTPDGWTSLYTIGDIAAPERYTVERFTGRAQIFEGDVVMWDELLHEVVFCNGGFALKLLHEDTNICCEIFGLHDDELPEVIGTIHNQPETSSK